MNQRCLRCPRCAEKRREQARTAPFMGAAASSAYDATRAQRFESPYWEGACARFVGFTASPPPSSIETMSALAQQSLALTLRRA